MKKMFVILSTVLLVGMVFAINSYASEEYIKESDIPNSTYIIGNFMFTKDTILTTKHIMLASKTIDSTNIEDMIIYYKNARGKWVDGLSGETITPKDEFDIKYKDIEILEDDKTSFTDNVDINTNDIDKSTYIIGKYMFTKDTVLTTRHIMLASRSIKGNTLSDMVIKYKNARGKWIDGLTGNEIKVEEELKINYKDLTPMFTITYNSNGGSEVNKSFVVLNGTTYGELEESTKEYATLDGWYDSISGGNKIESDTVVNLENNQTLYAHWIMDKYKVIYKINSTTEEVEEYEYFTKAVIKENDVNKPYTILSNAYFSYNYPESPASRVSTVYKKYINNGWTTTQNSKESVYKEGDIEEFNKDIVLYPCYKEEILGSEFKPVERIGYEFLGWYTDSYAGKKIEDKYYTGYQNKTFYAHWKAKTYTVEFDGQGGELETTSKIVSYDSQYGDLPTPIKEGYRFIGWYTSPVEGMKVSYRTYVELDKDIVLYARYEQD